MYLPFDIFFVIAGGLSKDYFLGEKSESIGEGILRPLLRGSPTELIFFLPSSILLNLLTFCSSYLNFLTHESNYIFPFSTKILKTNLSSPFLKVKVRFCWIKLVWCF